MVITMELTHQYKLSLCISILSLFFVAYNNLMRIPGIGESLDTQRVILLLFVFSSFFITQGRFKKDVIIFYALQLLFLLAILVQFIFIFNTIGLHQVIILLEILTLMLFADQLYFLLSIEYTLTFKTILFSGIFLVFYQLFQLLMFSLGHYSAISILNDPQTVEAANFLRIIGDSLGPAGFMAESSLVAMFIGPLFMFLIVADYYGHFKSSLLQRIILLVGVFLTLSGSATIQIAFILFTYLLIDLFTIKSNKNKLFSLCLKLIVYLLVMLIGWFIIYHYYGSYIDAVIYKITSLFRMGTPRTEGAKMLLERFSKHILWGEGFGKFIETGIESNIFLPTLLFEHGLLGSIMFLILFLFPILFRFAKSPFKLYFIPFLSLFVNIFFAIGTYRWPLIWITYILTLFNLSPRIFSRSGYREAL